MSYPANLPTKQVSFGSAVVLEGGAPLAMRVTISASRSLVHRPSGSPLIRVSTQFSSTGAGSGQVELPICDAPNMGIGDGTTIVLDAEHPVTHLYSALITYYADDTFRTAILGSTRTVGPFALLASSPAVSDVDDLLVGVPTPALGEAVVTPAQYVSQGLQALGMPGTVDEQSASIAQASTADRDRANHTGTQPASSISDFAEAAQDAVAAALSGVTGATVTYNDTAGTITITGIGDPETMRDTIGAAFVGVGNIGVTVDDAGNTITISTTATLNSTDAQLRDRSTHTGTQLLSTISDAGSAASKNAGTSTGDVALLGAGGTLPSSQPRRISACDFSFWYVNGESGTTGTDIGKYSRIKARAAVACHSLEINFAAASGIGEVALTTNTAGLTIRASIEVAGVFYKAYNLNGARDIVIDNEGLGKLYVPGFDIPVGVDIWIHSRVLVTDGQRYPVGYSTTGATGEVNSTIATAPTTDFTATAAGRPGASNLKTFHPTSITGVPYSPQPCIALVGDSITAGKGDPAPANADQGPGGWAVRTLSSDGSGRYAPSVPFVQVSISGESANNWATPAKRRARMKQIEEAGCTHAFVTLGVNDIVGSTVAVLQAAMLNVGTALAGRRMRAYASTLTPTTTSTDSWATTAGQTVAAGESKRVAYNAWVRAGMPLDPTTKAAVSPGTAGALLTGGAGHPYVGWMELADAVESARDSGLWKVTGSANGYTADGIHPSTVGHQAMATAAAPTVAAIKTAYAMTA